MHMSTKTLITTTPHHGTRRGLEGDSAGTDNNWVGNWKPLVIYLLRGVGHRWGFVQSHTESVVVPVKATTSCVLFLIAQMRTFVLAPVVFIVLIMFGQLLGLFLRRARSC